MATNGATEYVQVGDWVKIETAAVDTYADHKAAVAQGDSTTVTLTLQNPRGDGVAVTGYWSLSFDPDVIHVYAAANAEILPGQTFLTTVADTKTITVTVVGASGGSSDLALLWRVWSGGEYTDINVTAPNWAPGCPGGSISPC